MKNIKKILTIGLCAASMYAHAQRPTYQRPTTQTRPAAFPPARKPMTFTQSSDTIIDLHAGKTPISIETNGLRDGVGVAPTTQEEYNYLTKGYAIQIESGLDMKKGYKMVYQIAKRYDNLRTLTFYSLIREGETAACAILIIYHNTDNPAKNYICVPHYEADGGLWNDFYKKINDFSSDGARAMIWGLAKALAYFAQT